MGPKQRQVTSRARHINLDSMTLSHMLAIVPGDRARQWLTGFGSRLQLCVERERQRKALAELSDHQLRDIGLRREQIWAEIAKPPWR